MSGVNPEHITQLSFAGDLTQLIRAKLLDAINYIPYDESISMKAVDAGWFCIEPPIYCPEPMQGGDAFTIDYTGVQESLGAGDNPAAAIRSTVTSIKLFREGQPYTFEDAGAKVSGNTHSVLAGADAPPVIVNQTSLQPGIAQLDTALSGLGNWQAISRAERLQAGGTRARILNDHECRSIITAIARSTVDGKTLIRSLQN